MKLSELKQGDVGSLNGRTFIVAHRQFSLKGYCRCGEHVCVPGNSQIIYEDDQTNIDIVVWHLNDPDVKYVGKGSVKTTWTFGP